MTGLRSGLGLVFEISIPELRSRQLLSSTAWEHQAEESPMAKPIFAAKRPRRSMSLAPTSTSPCPGQRGGRR